MHKFIPSLRIFYKFKTSFDFNLQFWSKCNAYNLCFAYRPSYFMPRIGRKGFFCPSLSLTLFLIPVGSPTRDISRLLCRTSFQFLSRLLPAYVSAANRPNNRVARVIYSLISTVAGIVCEDCVYCRPRVIRSGH